MFFYKNGAFDPENVSDFQWIASKVTLPNGQIGNHQVCTFEEADEVWLALPGQRFAILQGEDFQTFLQYLFYNNGYYAKSSNAECRSQVGNFPKGLMKNISHADTSFPEDTPLGLEDDHPVKTNESGCELETLHEDDNFYPEALDD